MSAFREDVLDFVRWANREADRGDWPAPWADWEFTEHGPAPRRIFQDYLTERLAHARQEAGEGVVLVEADGEAVDIAPCGAGLEVTVRPPVEDAENPGGEGVPGTPSVLYADHVVLATGLELRDLPFATDVLGHASFIRNPVLPHRDPHRSSRWRRMRPSRSSGPCSARTTRRPSCCAAATPVRST